MAENPSPLERFEIETERLMEQHPPVWHHPNKQLVFTIACAPGSRPQGTINYTRWGAMPLPAEIDVRAADGLVEPREDAYDYAPTLSDPGAVEWHVNFADAHLFVAYSSGLFAQDEMQVAEHPALGSLREALLVREFPALTVEAGRPTPVLVMGVERRCAVATDRNAAEGRPEGLYGNAFARADAAAIRRATRRIDPPTITNIIAMAAPFGRGRRYNRETITYILVTAHTGFRAAVLESARARGAAGPVAVHTGFWGCGAFGGNRVLMALLQILAAQGAGLTRLVFHTFDRAGSRALAESRALLARELAASSPVATGTLIDRITALGFTWGVSDGN